MSDELDKLWRDRFELAARTAASLVPLVGGALAELVTEAIPRLRQERIVEYLRKLEVRLTAIEKEMVEGILEDREKIDLVEAGGFLAARATSRNRNCCKSAAEKKALTKWGTFGRCLTETK